MIIARIPDVSDFWACRPKYLDRLPQLSLLGSGVDVDPVTDRLPRVPVDPSPDWIYSFGVGPHRDVCFSGDFFLTLSVSPGRFLFADDVRFRGVFVPAGTFFVVDPRCPHWLVNKTEGSPLWVGVQWVVPRRRAPGVARRLVSALQGSWVRTRDERYKSWRTA